MINVGEHTPLRNIENGLELELTFNGEVLDGKVLFPVVGQALVESTIFISSDFLRVPRPNGLGLVKFLVLDCDFLDFLRFLRFVLVIDLFDLGLLLVFFVFFLFDLFLVVFNFLENNQVSVRWIVKVLSLTFSTSLVTAN